MSTNFNEMQTLCSNQFQAMNTANASTVKALQAIVRTERMDYSKKFFENGRVLFEKLLGVKKIDEAISVAVGFQQIRLRGLRRGIHEDRRDVFEPR